MRIRVLWPLFCALLVVATTADVLADGALRHLDRRIMLGPDGLRLESGGWFWLWRTVVWGGQYWFVAMLCVLAAIAVTVRRRSPWPLLLTGVWVVADQLVVYLFKKAVGRTFPVSGHDVLHTTAEAFPSGHAALGASCLLVLATLLAELASLRWTVPVAYALSALVGVATVVLGYHWPTDALAGWAVGILIGLGGQWLVLRTPKRVPWPARHGTRSAVSARPGGSRPRTRGGSSRPA